MERGWAALNALKLRDYSAGDWRAMWTLDVTCFEPVFRFSRGAMRDFAEAAGAVTILAEDLAGRSDDKVELAGFCIVQVEECVGYVVTLDVAERWRRRGLARRLMDEAERKVREAGGLAMALHVFTGNAGAIRFYEAMGYARARLAEEFYGRGVDAWVYEKRLGG